MGTQIPEWQQNHDGTSRNITRRTETGCTRSRVVVTRVVVACIRDTIPQNTRTSSHPCARRSISRNIEGNHVVDEWDSKILDLDATHYMDDLNPPSVAFTEKRKREIIQRIIDNFEHDIEVGSQYHRSRRKRFPLSRRRPRSLYSTSSQYESSSCPYARSRLRDVQR